MRKYRKNPSAINWQARQQAIHAVNELKKDLKMHYVQKALDDCKGDSKSTWKKLKELWPSKNRQNLITEIAGKTDAHSMANLLNNHFASVGSKIQAGINPVEGNALAIDKITGTPLQLKTCTPADISKLIANLRASESCGVDGITTRFLKDARQSIHTPLCHIFNLCINSSTFPKPWKTSHVVPLFKEGEKNCTNNYRPISLLSVTSKLLERWVHDLVYEHLRANKFFTSQQFGFRKGHSTATCLIDFLDGIYNDIEVGW